MVYTCNTDISTEQALERYSKVEHQGRERETGTQKADDGHTHSLTSVFLAQYSNSIDECKQKRFFVLCNSIAYKDKSPLNYKLLISIYISEDQTTILGIRPSSAHLCPTEVYKNMSKRIKCINQQ